MSFPADFDKKKNIIDEFMLKEYETIASAHFDSQNGLRQQFRFYLVFAAIPVTVLSLALRDRTGAELDEIQLLKQPYVVGYVFVASGILGVLMLVSMIHTALDVTMYARTVNGIRRYFVSRDEALSVSYRQYLKLPTDQTRPPYFHRKAFFYQLVAISLINCLYFVVGVSAFHYSPFISILIAVFGLAFQMKAYSWFCARKERKEIE